MGLLFSNFARATIATTPSPATTGTSLVVAAGTGALFPTPGGSDYFYAVLVRKSDNAKEIVKVTARSTDTMTIDRAEEGTTALTFATGDYFELRLTAGQLATYSSVAVANTWTAAQTFSAATTFSLSPVIPDATGVTEPVSLGQFNTNAVKLTGDQTVAGIKTFSSSPIVPTPTTSFQASTKAYADAASAVKTLVAPTSVNNVTAIDITSIPAAARGVEIELAFVAPVTDNVDLLLRTSTDNGSTFDASAGNYQYANTVNTVGGSIAANNSASTTALMIAQALGTAANENGSGRIRLHYPGDAQYCCADWEFTYRNQSSGTLVRVSGGGFRLAVADVDAVRILFSTGNINTCRYSAIYW